MDDGKILVVNLSKGLIGEDNASILGAFLVTKVQLAAMSRSDIDRVEDRRPFYLYVDEFQNFATDSFAVILSEARKYGLNLTVANQYVAQMTDSVRDAVFGNVGTTISFRVSADDAPILVKQFEPTFEESDIIQLNNRHFVISMIINGEKVPAFSATTLSIPSTPSDNFEAIVAHSREYFARPRLEVEAEIRATIEQSEKYKKELSDSGRQEEPKLTINTSEKPVFKPVSSNSTEQKPNLKASTPQADFRRQNMSPNQAEGKERLGLKDLARLIQDNQNEKGNDLEIKEDSREVKENTQEIKQMTNNNERKEKKGNEKKNNHIRRGKKRFEKKKDKTQVVNNGQAVPSVETNSIEANNNQSRNVDPTEVKSPNNTKQATPVSNSVVKHTTNSSSTTISTPVRPEVEYQEKSTVSISPSHQSISLRTPIKKTEDFASKDNSVDGFLSIRH